ncbi:FAFR290Wp [Eremothecium gossypii FDAG1]|nr:FAFR290Wp [Eremothecium gossypii FDAG1]
MQVNEVAMEESGTRMDMALHQKRHSSALGGCRDGLAKRRGPRGGLTACGLVVDAIGAEPGSPSYLPTTSSSNLDAAARAIDNSSLRQVSSTTLHDTRLELPSRLSSSPVQVALDPYLTCADGQSCIVDRVEHFGYPQEEPSPRMGARPKEGVPQSLWSPHSKSGFNTHSKAVASNSGRRGYPCTGSRFADAAGGEQLDDQGPSSNGNNGSSNNGDASGEGAGHPGGGKSSAGGASNGSRGNSDNSANNNSNGNNSGNSNDSDNNGNSDSSVPTVAVTAKQSSQALMEKLQEIYRNIVRQETELQQRCSQLTTSQTTDLKNLWIIYKVNAELIDNYFMFITTALLPTQPEADLLIGKEIIEVYRIERRLWVYGTITFLDVLKNFSNFMDPEVCCQFIIYVFISISNMLGDIPPKFSIIWLERLGDLSRMAIALYPSGFIDWKLSAEHWYREALKYTFGHGKLYYHMSTVQQNTLAAFVNLGKSVFCRDTFIPSQQYMQLVIDNIYQRAFAERNSGHHRNAHLVEYLKHTEVMLLPSFLESSELQDVVLAFFEQKFGVTSNVDFFDPRLVFVQDSERLKHFFRHASLYAESHLLQLVGFGDPRNPFALLFELPKHLKERKDRREKRKSKSSTSTQYDTSIDDDCAFAAPSEFFETIDSTKYIYKFPDDINIWKESLSYANVTAMKCSMIVLRKFLHGPLLTALPHLLPWGYFLAATNSRVITIPQDEIRRFWVALVRQLFPFNTIITFLNVLLLYMNNQTQANFPFDEYFEQFIDMSLADLVGYFCENEELPEVWECWGTLWFDALNTKHITNLTDINSTGVKDHMFMDSPIDGISFDHNDESGEKFWKRCARVILLFRALALECPFGLREISGGRNWRSLVFKFEEPPSEWCDMYLEPFTLVFDTFEQISPVNLDQRATPYCGMTPDIDIRTLQGYRILLPDYYCFNRNGDMITGSLYTIGTLESSGIHGGDDFNGKRLLENGELVSTERRDYNSLIDREEQPIMDEFLRHTHCKNDVRWEQMLPRGDLHCFADTHVTYFVLDATTWLRHFGHVYKLAANNILKFAICLTTFQELRFLRKSKDESVLEAATRAVITVRQLYYERKLLPLRFTGNVAGHLEEHLEIEEQMTWRSHVDEFVIEAIHKAQDKFNALNDDAKAASRDCIPTGADQRFNFIALVTDDLNMRNKAGAQNIKAFSTRFMFSVCNELGHAKNVCTN